MKTLDQSFPMTQHLWQRVFSHPDGIPTLVDNALVHVLSWELFPKKVEAAFKAGRENEVYMSEIKNR